MKPGRLQNAPGKIFEAMFPRFDLVSVVLGPKSVPDFTRTLSRSNRLDCTRPLILCLRLVDKHSP